MENLCHSEGNNHYVVPVNGREVSFSTYQSDTHRNNTEENHKRIPDILMFFHMLNIK